MLRKTTLQIYNYLFPEPASLAEALAARCNCNKEYVEDAIRDRKGARIWRIACVLMSEKAQKMR